MKCKRPKNKATWRQGVRPAAALGVVGSYKRHFTPV